MEYVRKIMDREYDAAHYSENDFQEFREALFNDPIGKAKNFFDEDRHTKYLQYWSAPGSLQAGLGYYKAISVPPANLFTAVNPPDKNAVFAAYHIDKVPTLVLWEKKDIYMQGNLNLSLEKWLSNLKVIE